MPRYDCFSFFVGEMMLLCLGMNVLFRFKQGDVRFNFYLMLSLRRFRRRSLCILWMFMR